jgi:hypothetical protein
MKLRVDRYKSTPEATLGKLYVDDVFECFTLEDEFRAVKVKAETRIPAGTYQIKLRTEGTHHQQYANKFPDIHKGMLWLQNVPGFQFILIHIGNTEKDTEGCLLIGADRDENLMTIGRSTVAYRHLYPKVAGAIEKGEVWITYKDLDR